MGEITKLSWLLDGSVDEQNDEELRSPVVQQGSSPPLTSSRNTRLSLRKGTCVRAPAVTARGVSLGAGAPAYGVVGASRTRRVAVYTTGDRGSRETAEDGASSPGSGVIRSARNEIGTTVGRQNGYLPLQMTAGGALPGVSAVGGISSAYNATTDELWVVWVAQNRRYDELGARFVYCEVFSGDGTLVASQCVVGATDDTKAGVTAHGANGTRLWTVEGGDVTMWFAELDGNAADLTAFPSAVVTGQTGDWDVCTISDTFVAFVGRSESAVDDGAFYKINVETAVKSGITLTGAMESGGFNACSVQHFNVSTLDLVAVAFSSSEAAETTYGLYNSGTMTQLWAPKTSTVVGRVSCKFLLAPSTGLSQVVYAISAVRDGSFNSITAGDTSDKVRTVMLMATLSDGTPFVLNTLNWLTLQNNGAQLTISSTETYPLFFFGRTYLTATFSDVIDPFSPNYTPDQSIEAYIVGPGFAEAENGKYKVVITPTARFGVVRGNLAPARTFLAEAEKLAAGPVPLVGTDLFVTYAKDSLGTNPALVNEYAGRYVRLSTTPQQPSVVVDKDGAALIAASLPAQWDGAETVELGGPLHAPRLIVTDDGDSGGGPPFDEGVYSWVAIYQWVDGAGHAHRSAPSNIASSSAFPGAESDKWPCVTVTLPDSMRNGDEQLAVDVLLYQTTTDGTSYHLVSIAPVHEEDDGVAQWTTLSMVAGSEPQIYSLGTLGEEITPQPPPPLRDIVIAQQRAWGIDAEVPTRLVYSKMRIPGIGYEFFPAGEVHVPSGAGDIVSIREWAGSVIVFTQRGVFQIGDIGPSNSIGGSGGFGQAAKISDVGCRTRLGVVNTPIGIVFQNNRRGFSVFAGSVQSLPGAEVDEDVTGGFLLEAADEVCFVTGDETRVFNYALQRWTLWDLPATPTLVIGSALDRNTGLMYAQATGNLYVLATDTLSSTAAMSWETDWVLLGGDFQDAIVLHGVLFNGRVDGDHGITVELFTNYDLTSSTSRSWSSSELNAIKNGAGRYTVRVEPVRQDTRAVKVKITESGVTSPYSGCRPGAITAMFEHSGIMHEEALNDACQK